MRLSRRSALRGALAFTVAGATPIGFRLHGHSHGSSSGKLCVFVQANGAWDPTSFCDPKANTAGERVINNWARTNEVQEIGNIRYAPFVQNQAFFEKYYERMLVINGVDAQTNSHTVGVVHNWSGISSEGYPTATAMYASEFGVDHTMPYLNYGGYSFTGGLTRFTRINNPNLIGNIAAPSYRENYNGQYLSDENWMAVEEFAKEKVRARAASPNLLPSQVNRLNDFHSAYSVDGLRSFADEVSAAGRLAGTSDPDNPRQPENRLKTQAQLTVLAFKTESAVSADLFIGGFDTHDNHDARQGSRLNLLTEGVDYLWDYAEQHGVADRMFVVLGSDFGRTNFYNADQGKDHWPIGSYVIMEKNQDWTNRMVGYTDELHFTRRVNPTTLERDDSNGSIIYPKHVHKAIRRYLNLNSSTGAHQFPFNATEDFSFFLV